MKTTEAVADLLRTDLVWRRFFKRCCELGAFRLRAQAWQFRLGLAERRVRADLEDVQDALLVIAGKTLPDTPAGRATAGASDWRDHALDCGCQDCSATAPRHASPGAKMAATGVVHAPVQAFDLAREYLNPTRAEKGGAA